MFSSQNSQVSSDANYIEDVFSTYLYAGNSGDQTITNNIDLLGKKGLVWIHARDGVRNHVLADNVSNQNALASNLTTIPSYGGTGTVNAFNSNGFTLGSTSASNQDGLNFVSWTFRKQPKFFDVVTYTGNGSNQTISHSLGSAPGCIIVKRLDAVSNWRVYHRSLSLPNESWMHLNTTDASFTSGGTNIWNVTSSSFQADTYLGLSTAGATYVAYLFAHNAGGFGLTGTDNVISCGSFTTDASANASVTLGYEPQWVLIKRTDSAGYWDMLDNMRGMTVGTSNAFLWANTSDAEMVGQRAQPFATGFNYNGSNSASYIYIAIRRGPMKVPTSGTSVFQPVARTGTGGATTQEIGLNGTDLAFTIPRTAAGNNWQWVDRLRGGAAGSAGRIQSNNTNQEFYDQSMSVLSSTQTTISYGGGGSNGSGVSYIVECFKRAPSFFDEVCYTGTGTAQNISHNLGVAPELMIVKNRTGVSEWTTYQAPLGASQVMRLNSTIAAFTDASVWNGTAPTSSVFSVGTSARSNDAGSKFVIYLFATCAGVSKVGSYTGNGTTQTINCGFTGGARFVMIKATSTTGDWMVADSARGIVSGSDPYLELNNTNAEVTGEDWLDTDSTGFVVNEVSGSNANTNGVTYIYLAIA